MEQGTDAWRAWRLARVTATDTAKVLRGDRWAIPPNQVWADKTRVVDASPQMRFGSAIEPWARSHASVARGHAFEATCWEHAEHPWLVASLDGIHFGNTPSEGLLLEIKAGAGDRRIIEQTGEPSGYVWHQVQHQLLVTGCRRALLVSYPCLPSEPLERAAAARAVEEAGGAVPVPESVPKFIEIDADDAAHARILATARAIWNCRP